MLSKLLPKLFKWLWLGLSKIVNRFHGKTKPTMCFVMTDSDRGHQMHHSDTKTSIQEVYWEKRGSVHKHQSDWGKKGTSKTRVRSAGRLMWSNVVHQCFFFFISTVSFDFGPQHDLMGWRMTSTPLLRSFLCHFMHFKLFAEGHPCCIMGFVFFSPYSTIIMGSGWGWVGLHQ